DDDQLDIMLRFQAPAFCPEFKNVQRGGIVDDQGSLLKPADLGVYLRPFPFLKVTLAYFFLFYLGFAGYQTVNQLNRRHLKRKYHNRLIKINGGITRAA